MPVLADSQPVRIAPGESKDVTFLFAVPSDVSPDTVTVQGLRPASVPSVDRPRLVGTQGLAGRFIETAPRNLKPLMTDPVIAAIQKEVNHRLLVHGRGETLPARVMLRRRDPEAPVTTIVHLRDSDGHSVWKSALSLSPGKPVRLMVGLECLK